MTGLRFGHRELDHPVEVAPRVWWVGAQMPDDRFKCHAYLVEAGDQSVLVDPGSTITIDEVLAKVDEVVGIDRVRWLVCHHSDPDIADGLHRLNDVVARPDAGIVTEWRAAALLKHYGSRLPVHLVEDHDWQLDLGEGRLLRFLLTPYLHFPGALVSYLDDAGVLFSSDLFGGFNNAGRLYAERAEDFGDLRQFHEHYMPSREILQAGLRRIRDGFGEITTIAPQHGYVIPQPLVAPFMEQLEALECGLFLLARTDLDIQHLLHLAEASRRLVTALLLTHDLGQLTAVARRELGDLMPVSGFEVHVTLPGEGRLRFSEAGGIAGTAVGPEPTDTPLVSRRMVLPIPALGADDPPADLVIDLADDLPAWPEMAVLFAHAGPALRSVLDRHLAARRDAKIHSALLERSLQDPLTGLLNRRALEDVVLTDRATAILLVDLDHFKHVNDEHGHDAGDRVLQAAAAAVSGCVRETDRVVRYGGEEILVALTDARIDPAATGERLRLAVASMPADDLPPGVHVTTSVGVALRRSGESLAELVRRADRALYEAKQGGRNRVAIAHE